jgi:hypothetical protein
MASTIRSMTNDGTGEYYNTLAGILQVLVLPQAIHRIPLTSHHLRVFGKKKEEIDCFLIPQQ